MDEFKCSNLEMVCIKAKAFAMAVPWSEHFLTPYPFHQGFVVCEPEGLVTLTEDTYLSYVVRQADRVIKHAKESLNPVTALFFQMSKPYRLQFLDLVKEDLDMELLGELLSWIWIHTEFPNQTGISRWVKLFKTVGKPVLMTEEEQDIYNALPEEFVAYRGVQAGRAKVRGMSWTLSLEKAEWFANRWRQKGTVYKARVKKDAIFAYFKGRGEEEIVVNPRKLLAVVPVYNTKEEVNNEFV